MSRLIQTKGITPATPAANKVAYFTNTATRRLNYIDDLGVTGQVGGINSWYDVTDYGLKGDDATDNLAAWNALYALIPANSTIYFPAGTYRFSAALEGTDKHITVQGAGITQSLLKTTSTTAHLFNFAVESWYWTFRDLGFRASVVKTAGAFINCPTNSVALLVDRCEFQNYFIAINLASTQAGNIGILANSYFNTPAVNGTGIVIDGSNINIMLTNLNVNSGTVAGSVGVAIKQSGAVQITGCDIIGGVNCLLVNATGVVSAIFSTNTFYDQSTLGSTVKFMGTFAISRVKFVQCGITCGTTGAVGLVALEIAGTGTGTAIPDGIDFVNCDFYNNAGAGTTIGILATGVRNFSVIGSRISGFTRGFDITPYNAAGVTSFKISDNVIGATENFAANGTGILLNAGAFAYGSFNIAANNFNANTTAQITDNSSFPAGTASLYQKKVDGNIGSIIQAKSANYTATTIPLTTVTNVDSQGGMFIPAIFRAATIRITVRATNAATAQTLTATVRYGVNNSNADAAIQTQAFTAGTAAAGSGLFVFNVTINTSTTADSFIRFQNGNNAATGIAGVVSLFSGLSTLATISTAANNWLGVYFSSATASAITIRSVTYEVVSQ